MKTTMLKAMIMQSGRMKAKYIVLTGSIHLEKSSIGIQCIQSTSIIIDE